MFDDLPPNAAPAHASAAAFAVPANIVCFMSSETNILSVKGNRVVTP